MRKRALLFGFSALLCALPAAARIEVHATLSPSRIGLTETAILTVEITNDNLSSLRFSPHFELDNFELAGETQQMNDLRYGSNGLSRTFRIVWRLRPLSLGRAAVRKIAIEVNGTVLPLADREVVIQRQPTQAPAGDDEADNPFSQFFGRFLHPLRRVQEPRQPALFLRQEVEPQRAVVGQQLLYTVYLYARRDVAIASPAELPKFKGFWVREIPQPQRLRSDFVEVGGERYSRVAVLHKALFPLHSGLFVIEPVSYDFAVRVLENDFFGPAIEHSEPVHLTSPPLSLEVAPLPAEPPGFSGAVGPGFSLTATLTPRQVRLGEAATLTLSLGGEGNLHALDEMKVVPPAGLELSAPQQEGKDELRGTNVHGERVWRFSVIPKGTGSFRIDPPRLPYFDPSAKAYRIAAAEPLTLTVLPAEPKASEEGARATTRPPRLTTALRRALPWGVAGLSTLVALLAVRKRRPQPPPKALGSIPARTAPAALHLRLTLDQLAREPRASALAQQMEAAWRNFLESAYALPLGAPTSRWTDILAGQGRNGPIRKDLDKLLEDLRYLRYAPQLASVEEVRSEALAASERLFERLARG